MKFLKPFVGAALLTAGLFGASTARAGHVYAGIIDTDGLSGLGAGDALAFVTSSTGLAITGDSLGVQSMSLVTVGTKSGLYMTSAISFTALSNGMNWTGSAYSTPNKYAAVSGSYIVMKITSVTGPVGGTFSFWDDEISLTNPAMTYTIGTGLSGSLSYIPLTDSTLIVGDGVNDGVGEPPTAVNGTTTAVDPYGHIHGRSFTADIPGTYTVSYVLSDLNGKQADSQPFVVTYQAVPEPAAVALLGAAGLAALAHMRRRRSTQRN